MVPGAPPRSARLQRFTVQHPGIAEPLRSTRAPRIWLGGVVRHLVGAPVVGRLRRGTTGRVRGRRVARHARRLDAAETAFGRIGRAAQTVAVRAIDIPERHGEQKPPLPRQTPARGVHRPRTWHLGAPASFAAFPEPASPTPSPGPAPADAQSPRRRRPLRRAVAAVAVLRDPARGRATLVVLAARARGRSAQALPGLAGRVERAVRVTRTLRRAVARALRVRCAVLLRALSDAEGQS